MKTANDLELASQQEDYHNAIASIFGKEALSADLISRQDQATDDKCIEEKLLEESVRLNALLHCSNNEIVKLKREISRNGDTLATAEERKD